MKAIKIKKNNLKSLDYSEAQQINGGFAKVAVGWKVAAGLGVIGLGVLVGACAVYGAFKLVQCFTD
ncbi:hypothetical protein QLX67_12790 [Balneolaceae bacterium ANBcel3]|nr:hypothetical protein [Balneolaceae bacterium ANBcel3]